MEKGIRLTEKILTVIINDKTADGALQGAAVAKEALYEVRLLQKAFDKACEEAADSCCPHEMELYECDKCDECPHQGELHEDTERDIECWKQYYLQEAAQ